MFKSTPAINFMAFIIVLVIAFAGMLLIDIKFSNWDFGGNDFFINWFSTRTLIIEGKSPYSDEVVDEIRGLLNGRISNFNAEDGVISSPLYSFVLTFPFAMIKDFVVARAFWIISNQIAVIILILVLQKITRWRPGLWEFALVFMCIFLSHLAISAYVSGNMIIWTSLFLVLALDAISVKRDELAGGLLALTTFQPQIFLLIILFIIFWALKNHRNLIIFWFFGMIFILTSISLLFVPAWPLEYIRILAGFMDYFPYILPHTELIKQWPGIGVQLSFTITLLVGVIMILESWFARVKEFRWFFWTTCLVLVLTRLIGIPIHALHNFILVIPLFLVYTVLRERWKKSAGWLAIIIVVIFLGGWKLLLDHILINQLASEMDLLYLPPFIILISLYWVRWWAIRSLPALYSGGSLSWVE